MSSQDDLIGKMFSHSASNPPEGWRERFREIYEFVTNPNNWKNGKPAYKEYVYVSVYNALEWFIREELQSQRKELVIKIKSIPKKNHICRFNDGEQTCDCYLEGRSVVINLIQEKGK